MIHWDIWTNELHMNCGSIFSTNDYIAARFMRNSYEAQKDCQKDGEKNKTTIKNRSQLVG